MSAKGKSKLEWYLPGSVLNALWGNVMPRLAASVWKGDLDWPPSDVTPVSLEMGLKAYPLEGSALEDFANQLVTIAFRRNPRESWPDIEKNYVKAAKDRNRLTTAQRSTLVATEYFHPGAAAAHLQNRPPTADQRMTLRVIEAKGYDFVLSNEGLDVFVPPTPGAGNGTAPSDVDPKKAQQEVLQFYKFRETSKPPIGLPRSPATAFDPADGSFITIPQLTAPTGAFQVPEGWMRSMAPDVDWWISGSLYRGIMSAYPRMIASKWYEEVAWDPAKVSKYTKAGEQQTYGSRFKDNDEVKEMIEERVETVLPDQLTVQVGGPPPVKPGADGWNDEDIMITNHGIYFPDPGPAPDWTELLDAIEQGIAGNPVFTDSSPCA